MAAYVLLNPQSQPNAAAVAVVIAIVMMPMALIGPFVGPLLDRFRRRSTVVSCDLVRLALATVLAVLIGAGATTGAWQLVLIVMLVVILSLNRLQLAALTAGMPNTVEPDEYLEAASVMPMLGPVSMLLGGGATAAIRFGLASSPKIANTLVFALAAVCFLVGIWFTRRFASTDLGPRMITRGESVSSVLNGLRDAWGRLRAARPASTAIALVFATRAGYGLLMTMVVVVYRQFFPAAGLQSSVLSMGAWFAATGIGFAASGLVAAPLMGRFGLRRALIGALGVVAVAQLISAAAFNRPVLVITGLVIGVCVQSIKIAADTLIQAWIDDETRGRVTLLHDIINNSGYVAGAVIAAVVLPVNGFSIPVVLGLGIWFAVLAVWFITTTRGQDPDYDAGTVRGA